MKQETEAHILRSTLQSLVVPAFSLFIGMSAEMANAQTTQPVAKKQDSHGHNASIIGVYTGPIKIADIVTKGEVATLSATYSKFLIELKADLVTLAPLVAQDKAGQRVDWDKLMNDWNGAQGGALNHLIRFELDYDGIGALNAVGKLTSDPKFTDAAEALAQVFARAYVIPSNGGIPGYKNHSNGLAAVAERTQDPVLLRAIILAGTKASYVDPNDTSKQEMLSPFLSRETALTLDAILNANAASNGVSFDKSLFDYHVTCLQSHLAFWQKALDKPGVELPDWPKTVNGDNQGIQAAELAQVQSTYVRPFMVSLSSLAAVSAFNADASTRPALDQAAATLTAMQKLWDESTQSFPYTDRLFPKDHPLTKGSDGLTTDPTPDLNALIGSAYIQVGHAVGNVKLQAFGEKVFHAQFAVNPGRKQMNQSLKGFERE